MNNFEKIVADKVRQHRYLYDPKMRDHADIQMIKNAWKEIAVATGKDEVDCRRAWKNLRDKFVRIKKRVYTRNIESSPYTIMTELKWLCQFVKHRERGPNVKVSNKCFYITSINECMLASLLASLVNLIHKTGVNPFLI